MNSFKSATAAFNWLYEEIKVNGYETDRTYFLNNQLICIKNPKLNIVVSKHRVANVKYLVAESNWYDSQVRTVDKIGKIAPIWNKMADENGQVNSNYGWQINRRNQLKYVINLLKTDPDTRRAVLTIYDGKEWEDYTFDTPCTTNIQFMIVDGKLDCTVNMRSNDLILGFVNDVFWFTSLQMKVAKELQIKVGKYYHYVTNLHIYKK